jgi:hypothetical protein
LLMFVSYLDARMNSSFMRFLHRALCICAMLYLMLRRIIGTWVGDSQNKVRRGVLVIDSTRNFVMFDWECVKCKTWAMTSKINARKKRWTQTKWDKSYTQLANLYRWTPDSNEQEVTKIYQ